MTIVRCATASASAGASASASLASLPDDCFARVIELAPIEQLLFLVRADQRSARLGAIRLRRLRALCGPPFSLSKDTVLNRRRSHRSCEDLDSACSASLPLSDASSTILADALCSGALEELEELSLMAGSMSSAGLVALARSFGTLTRLESLNLSFNFVGDSGLRALVEAGSAGALPTLKRLLLSHNPFTQAGVQFLAGALQAPTFLPSLTSLGVPAPHRSDPRLRAACAARRVTILMSAAEPPQKA